MLSQLTTPWPGVCSTPLGTCSLFTASSFKLIPLKGEHATERRDLLDNAGLTVVTAVASKTFQRRSMIKSKRMSRSLCTGRPETSIRR